MEDNKTQIVTFNKLKEASEVNNGVSDITPALLTQEIETPAQVQLRTSLLPNLKTHEGNNSQSDAVNLQNNNQQIQSSGSLKIKKPHRLQQINRFYSYFPDFYIKELKNAFALALFWVVILVSVLSLSAWAIYEIVSNQNVSDWCILLLIVPLGITIAATIVYLNKYFNFRCEAKTINFKDEKNLTINVVKLYKSLKTGYININWTCALTYTASLLTMLIVCIVGWAQYGTSFGDTNFHGDKVLQILFWFCVAAIILTFILNITLIVWSHIRTSRIENFYNFMIVSNEELTQIKKHKNLRDLFIFLAIVGTIFLIGWLVYKLVKKNSNKTKVVVS